MEARFNYAKTAPGVYQAMEGLEQYLEQCGLEKRLMFLVQLRASQINGCAYCLDMHWKDLRTYYSDRERAALGWTESVTLITQGHVPDAVYTEARSHFSDKELSDLTLAVAAINAWNRLSIAARIVPGGYQPAKAQELKKGA